MKKIDPALHAQLTTLIRSMGLEFIGAEVLPQAGRAILRLYIDNPQTGGVTIDECTSVSRQVGAMFDVDSPFADQYILEVSSPGIDRLLFEVSHFEQCVGQKVKVKLYVPVEGRRKWTGRLESVNQDAIELRSDDGVETVALPFNNIEKANVIGEVKF